MHYRNSKERWPHSRDLKKTILEKGNELKACLDKFLPNSSPIMRIVDTTPPQNICLYNSTEFNYNMKLTVSIVDIPQTLFIYQP